MWLIVSLLCCILGQSFGSDVTFSSTPPEIQPLITDSLTLRCGLADTPHTTSSIIGRSVRDDVTRRDAQPSDVQFVTSMVITKSGVDVAAMTEHLKATSFGNDSNTNVTGSFSAGQGEKGYLQIQWKYPTQQQIGEYKCDVSGVNKKGHNFDFSKNIEIVTRDITMNDIVNNIYQLKHDRDSLEKTDAQLRQTIMSLQHQIDTHVFFSVAISKKADLPAYQVLVYDKIYANVGGNYNVSTGAFVCPLSGYYHFEIHALSENDSVFKLGLEVNGRVVIAIYGTGGHEWQGSSNSVTVHLDVHDVIKVAALEHSVLYDDSRDDYSTFSGTLVAQD